MKPAVRTWIFLPLALALAGLFAWGILGLPAFGHYRGPYGDLVNAVTVPERHITDAVAAVNFDVRAFDTLGEEYILFASVMGAALLLRKHRGEQERHSEDRAPQRRVPRAGDAVRVFAVSLVGTMTVFGFYIVSHGQVSPGGGFQGGVILASAPLLVYLAGEFTKLRRVAPHAVIEVAEALGAAGYVAIGAIGWIAGGGFLRNTLPLGKPGDVFSGGMVLLLNLTVGLAVAAGFLVLLSVYLEETLSWKDPI